MDFVGGERKIIDSAEARSKTGMACCSVLWIPDQVWDDMPDEGSAFAAA
jgi:hypothetical protein